MRRGIAMVTFILIAVSISLAYPSVSHAECDVCQAVIEIDYHTNVSQIRTGVMICFTPFVSKRDYQATGPMYTKHWCLCKVIEEGDNPKCVYKRRKYNRQGSTVVVTDPHCYWVDGIVGPSNCAEKYPDDCPKGMPSPIGPKG